MAIAFKILYMDVDNVGKRVASSKKNYTWVLESESAIQRIECQISKYSKKKTIKVDGKQVFESDRNHVFHAWKFARNKIEIEIGDTLKPELRINGKEASGIYMEGRKKASEECENVTKNVKSRSLSEKESRFSDPTALQQRLGRGFEGKAAVGAQNAGSPKFPPSSPLLVSSTQNRRSLDVPPLSDPFVDGECVVSQSQSVSTRNVNVLQKRLHPATQPLPPSFENDSKDAASKNTAPPKAKQDKNKPVKIIATPPNLPSTDKQEKAVPNLLLITEDDAPLTVPSDFPDETDVMFGDDSFPGETSAFSDSHSNSVFNDSKNPAAAPPFFPDSIALDC